MTENSNKTLNTTPKIKSIINEILRIEKEYQNYSDLSHHKDKENQLCDAIIRIIEKEVKK